MTIVEATAQGWAKAREVYSAQGLAIRNYDPDTDAGVELRDYGMQAPEVQADLVLHEITHMPCVVLRDHGVPHGRDHGATDAAMVGGTLVVGQAPEAVCAGKIGFGPTPDADLWTIMGRFGFIPRAAS